MLVRIWKVSLAPNKAAELERFATNISLPMFKTQPGCLGVLFTRTETECATISIWQSEHAVESMEQSALYKQVVRQIEQSGILREDHHTEVFLVYGGFVSTELAAMPELRT